jgi:aldose 1-epimerase
MQKNQTKMKQLIFLIMLLLVGCMGQQHKYVTSKRSDFQMTLDGGKTDLYYLKNKNGIEMAVTNFGARVVELWVPDKNGQFADIVLGYDNINKYVDNKGERFLGATIGRYGNRIANGRFTLNDTEYVLPINNKPNSLHGGFKGFDMVVWDVKQLDKQSLKFTYYSKDGEEGYPGNLQVTMTYQLTDKNEFIVTHNATTDKTTVINLTHHSFFNLHGEGIGSINDHILMINADKFTPVDSVLIPTGEIMSVDSTPMDFRTPTVIGSRLNENFIQLKLGGGYDHNWVLNRKTEKEPELAASVYEPVSGRYMEVWTTEPGIQFYGGNFFDGKTKGKRGGTYDYRGSFALETQHFPDSPNRPGFPSTVLNPGETYNHVCIYKFGVK